MIRRVLASLFLVLTLALPVSAQERVTIGTMRQIANGALFLAHAQGYFKAEGLDVEMVAYASESDVAEAVAANATDLGLGALTPTAFNYIGRGYMKAIAAQAREKRDYEGTVVIASTMAYANGLRSFDALANKAVAIDKLGTPFHYQVAQIARAKRLSPTSITVKPMQTIDEIARAVGTEQADAALLPAQYARELLTASQARFVGWYSEIDEYQFGALFASTKAIETKRETIEKFVRAYQRGIADYSALLRLDRGKRVSTPKTRDIATIIARYAYPGKQIGTAAATVEANAFYMDPQGKLDLAEIARQVEWYKAQGFVEASVDPKSIVDTSFVK
jgi:NitT/TauT family transport system substrate-binding protein